MGKDIKNTTSSITRRLSNIADTIIVTYFAFNIWPIGVVVGGKGSSAIADDKYSVIIGAAVGAVIGGSVAVMLFCKLKDKGNAQPASVPNSDGESNTANNRYYTKFK